MASFYEIFKAAFVTGKLTVVRILTGLSRSKLNAVVLGASGVGLYSQANYFFLFLTSACSLGLVNGMMQRISYNRERNLLENQRNVQATVLTTQLTLLVLVLAASFFLIISLNKYLFSADNKEANIFIFLIIASIPFSVVSSNYMEGFFFSYGRYDLYTRASIVATIIGFIFFIPLVYFFGVHGAFCSILLSAIALFLSYIFYIKKIEKLSNVFVFGFQKKIFFDILPEGFINLFYGALIPLSALFIRNLIIRNAGTTENGLYQICTSITALYIPFLTNPLWAKLFPEISAKGATKQSVQLLYDMLLFIICFSALCLLMLFIKPDLIIYLISSKEFIGSLKFFPSYFLGDFFFNILFVYSVYLLALRKIKEYLIIWIVFFALQYLFSFFLISYAGPVGIGYAYAISACLLGIYVIIVFSKLFADNFKNIFYLIIITTAILFLEGYLLQRNFNFIFRLLLIFIWGGLIFLLNKSLVKKLIPGFFLTK